MSPKSEFASQFETQQYEMILSQDSHSHEHRTQTQIYEYKYLQRLKIPKIINLSLAPVVSNKTLYIPPALQTDCGWGFLAIGGDNCFLVSCMFMCRKSWSRPCCVISAATQQGETEIIYSKVVAAALNPQPAI